MCLCNSPVFIFQRFIFIGHDITVSAISVENMPKESILLVYYSGKLTSLQSSVASYSVTLFMLNKEFFFLSISSIMCIHNTHVY